MKYVMKIAIVTFCGLNVLCSSAGFTTSSSTMELTDEAVNMTEDYLLVNESNEEMLYVNVANRSKNNVDLTQRKINDSEIFENGQTPKEEQQRSFIFINNGISRLPSNSKTHESFIDEFINAKTMLRNDNYTLFKVVPQSAGNFYYRTPLRGDKNNNKYVSVNYSSPRVDLTSKRPSYKAEPMPLSKSSEIKSYSYYPQRRFQIPEAPKYHQYQQKMNTQPEYLIVNKSAFPYQVSRQNIINPETRKEHQYQQNTNTLPDNPIVNKSGYLYQFGPYNILKSETRKEYQYQQITNTLPDNHIVNKSVFPYQFGPYNTLKPETRKEHQYQQNINTLPDNPIVNKSGFPYQFGSYNVLKPETRKEYQYQKNINTYTQPDNPIVNPYNTLILVPTATVAPTMLHESRKSELSEKYLANIETENQSQLNCFSRECPTWAIGNYRGNYNNGILRGFNCVCQSMFLYTRTQDGLTRERPWSPNELAYFRKVNANNSDDTYEQLIKETKKLTRLVDGME